VIFLEKLGHGDGLHFILLQVFAGLAFLGFYNFIFKKPPQFSLGKFYILSCFIYFSVFRSSQFADFRAFLHCLWPLSCWQNLCQKIYLKPKRLSSVR